MKLQLELEDLSHFLEGKEDRERGSEYERGEAVSAGNGKGQT